MVKKSPVNDVKQETKSHNKMNISRQNQIKKNRE